MMTDITHEETGHHGFIKDFAAFVSSSFINFSQPHNYYLLVFDHTTNFPHMYNAAKSFKLKGQTFGHFTEFEHPTTAQRFHQSTKRETRNSNVIPLEVYSDKQ